MTVRWFLDKHSSNYLLSDIPQVKGKNLRN